MADGIARRGRAHQLDSILQRVGGPIAVGEQESALVSELPATSSSCQVSFPCRQHRGRAGRAVLLPNMPFGDALNVSGNGLLQAVSDTLHHRPDYEARSQTTKC